MPSEAPSLQRLSPPSPVLRASPTPRRHVRLGLQPCAGRRGRNPHRSRSPTFNAFLSLRAVSATPGERDGASVELLPIPCCLRPIWRGSASPFLVTRLRLSSLRARPADSQLRDCVPEHPGPASAGHLAVPRRGLRYPFRSTILRDELLSFHEEGATSWRTQGAKAAKIRQGNFVGATLKRRLNQKLEFPRFR